MSNRTLLAVAAVLAFGLVGAYAQMGPGMMHGGMMVSPRHVYYMHTGLPPAYADKIDPLKATSAVLARGRKLYAENCASCHGANGDGNGAAGRTLDPPPADLSFTMSMPIAQDDFLYWTIAEGGQQFGSAMPAFKSVLKPNEIWSIVEALRNGELQEK